MTKGSARLRFTTTTSPPIAGEMNNISTKRKYKKFLKKSNNYLAPKQLYYELYCNTYQKTRDLCNIVEILQFAKVVNWELTQDLKDYCLLVIAEFIEQFNNDFSKLLGIHVKFSIYSNKWTYLYTDKSNFPLPTIKGFEL